jgi:hypothetical protein
MAWGRSSWCTSCVILSLKTASLILWVFQYCYDLCYCNQSTFQLVTTTLPDWFPVGSNKQRYMWTSHWHLIKLRVRVTSMHHWNEIALFEGRCSVNNCERNYHRHVLYSASDARITTLEYDVSSEKIEKELQVSCILYHKLSYLDPLHLKL